MIGRYNDMEANITRNQALKLLQKYNKEPFHIYHGLTVEGVMKCLPMNLDTAMTKNFGVL